MPNEPAGVHSCAETYGVTNGVAVDRYLQCGAPAFALIQHRGRTEGPYWMCPFHARHNIKNRNAELIGGKDPDAD